MTMRDGIVVLTLVLMMTSVVQAAGCPPDRTDQESARLAIKAPRTKGTGLFLMFMSEEGTKTTTDVRKDITYREALQLGKKAVAFEWIANSVLTPDKIDAVRQFSVGATGAEVKEGERCPNYCTNGYCDRCCPLGTLCNCTGGSNYCRCTCN